MRRGGDGVRGDGTGGEGQFALHALREYTMLADGERGAIAACDPGRGMLMAGAAVDTAHAASMVLLCRTGRPARRAGLADGAVAVFFALAGWTLSWAASSG